MAVLFADVSDSTHLYEALGDTGAFGKVRECLAMLTEVASEYEGRVVKTIGEARCAYFPLRTRQRKRQAKCSRRSRSGWAKARRSS